jgi:ubiquitin carboxyl-terminal hydrolase 34
VLSFDFQIEQGPRPHCKYLGEYFSLLYEFAKMGENEQVFLLQVKAIHIMVSFFMAHKNQHGYVEIMSDNEEADCEVVVPQEDKYRPQSLEKMIALVAMLVESSRGQDKQLHLSQSDYQAIIGSNKVCFRLAISRYFNPILFCRAFRSFIIKSWTASI